jgi:colanic acid/amylovoran biosynthesis glycosyltransferase
MDRMRIIPVGFPATNFVNEKINHQPSEILTILSVGRLMQLKGHRLALEALEKIFKKGIRNWRYTIIGDGPESDRLTSFILNSGMYEHVNILGHLSYSEVRVRLAHCDIFIHPSITDNTGRAEAQGLAIQEAQAMGVAVVAFDSGGIADGIPMDTGILVPEGDINVLSGTIEVLMNNEDLRNKLGKTAQKWAREHYNSKVLTQKLLQFVKEH